MTVVKIKYGKCRILFLDLEFYVPKEKRAKHGFNYNPWDPDCKILGGTFLSANPEKDFEIPEANLTKKTRSFWLWDSKSEKELVNNIYSIMKETLDIVHNAHEGAVAPLLCGIGITSSDVPIIFELFKRYGIMSNEDAFVFQNKFRAVDLSQLAIGTFNQANYFLYPKTKNAILAKFLNDKKFESGTAVWDYYENGDFESIKARVMDEVIVTHQCYELIKKQYDRFKSLEATEKKRSSKTKKMLSVSFGGLSEGEIISVGSTYTTNAGLDVVIVSESKVSTETHLALGDDGITRIASGEKIGDMVEIY